MRLGCFGRCENIEDVAVGGFDFIELNLKELIELDEQTFNEVRHRLDRLGLGADACSWVLPPDLDFTSPDVTFDAWRDYIRKGVERSAALGTTLWPIGSGFGRRIKPENGSPEEQKARVRDFLAQIAEEAEKAGISAVIEPLGPAYSNHLLTLSSCAALIGELPETTLKTMCDLRHMYCAGDPFSEIEKWGQLIAHAHIDCPLGDRRVCPEPDDGFDYTPYIRAIRSIGVKRLSVENLNGSFKHLSAGVRYLRNLTEN